MVSLLHYLTFQTIILNVYFGYNIMSYYAWRNFKGSWISIFHVRNELSRVSLKFLDKGQKVVRLVHGNQYTLRAEISSPDGNH